MQSTQRWTAIAEFVRTHREQAGCTVDTLASAIHRDPDYVKRIERGEEFIPIRIWEMLGSVLGFDPADGIRLAAESIPPLTPESRARLVAAVETFIERQRVFLRGKREARGLTFGDVAMVVRITPAEAEAIENGSEILFTRDRPELSERLCAVLAFTFDEWMEAVSPPRG